ncbi:hypothetical protein EVAR_79981_1 [Eumeta japonica]|uniref:Uncharacterized protein n=1 Tax=Eumeta variegata TaxID=151549 RepID=A0A4C2A536_EUMVA|nr:hypothetical protein EVAR_79981_1 [Eumeta japonica]
MGGMVVLLAGNFRQTLPVINKVRPMRSKVARGSSSCARRLPPMLNYRSVSTHFEAPGRGGARVEGPARARHAATRPHPCVVRFRDDTWLNYISKQRSSDPKRARPLASRAPSTTFPGY